MRASSFLAPLFLAASSLAQAVEEGIEPSSSAPAGCERDVKGNFTIGVQNFFSGRSRRETAQQAADGALLCTLEDGILRDQYSRTGSVVANRQFQFDGPPQAGAIYTGGFSVCQNNSLAIGGSTRWWRCMSGAFGNLYDESIGDQCTEIRIVVDLVNDPSPSSSLVLPASSTLSLISTGRASVTWSASAISSSSGASSAPIHSTASSGSSTTSASRSTSSLASTTGSASGSVTDSASSSSSPTASGAAPPASEGAATSSVVMQGAVLGALLTFVAVLVL
ncbi:covalently-linked cell wall protein [Stagonosporopsis vannaccii]|nr:covalently-linked cell wall protein [Stagonosporopsis vannaccii]